MENGTLKITILDDGTIKTETGDMSGPLHQSADNFLREIARLAGGDVTTEKTKHSHRHNHNHNHEHTHDTHKH